MSKFLLMKSGVFNGYYFVLFSLVFLSIFIILTRAAQITGECPPVNILSLPLLRVDPLNSIGDVGTNISITLFVENIYYLQYVNISLSYPVEILDAIDISFENTSVENITKTVYDMSIDRVKGDIHIYYILDTTFSGSGSLARITFRVTGMGSGILDIHDDILLNSCTQPIPHDTQDGKVTEPIPTTTTTTILPVPSGRIDYKIRNNTINLTFVGNCTEQCKKIVFVQVVCRYALNWLGNYVPYKPSDKEPAWRQKDNDTVDGGKNCTVDYIIGERDPYYNGDDGDDSGDQGNHTAGNIRDTTMTDAPYSTDNGIDQLSKSLGTEVIADRLEFETCVYCNSSADSGKYYRCILWRYARSKGENHHGTSRVDAITDAPSKKFIDAVNKWLSNPH